MSFGGVDVAVCIGCGCTDVSACIGHEGPCRWLAVDYNTGRGVCSECPEKLEEIKREYEEKERRANRGRFD